MAEPAGLYVYALIRAASATRPLGTGIDALPLLAVPVGGVAAVVHDHPGEPYGGDDETLRRRVLEHNDVVDRLWSSDHAVLPMTFDVIVAGAEDATARDRLEAWLSSSEEALLDGLARVDGRVELRVDLALDRAEATVSDPDVRALRDRIAGEQPGIARLLRKRLDGLERDAAELRADRGYPAARGRLARLAQDLVENPRTAPEDGRVLVLSAALLVDEPAVEAVGAELAAMTAEEPALRVRFLGPWPPYSFAALRPAAGRAPAAAG